MHLMSVDSINAQVDDRILFSDVSFGLSTDDRVAVVGPNGSGKTTLLRILAGEREPDAGEVVTRNQVRIALLSQEADLDGEVARAAVLAADATAQPHEAEALLDRLGVAPDHPTAAMSGGQTRRVSLARTLLTPADLLILDEPTNHLDVDTIDWLEEELGRRACGLVLVTHDRYLLERLTNRMLDLAADAPGEPAAAYWHDGSYSSLLEARAERAERRQRATERAQNLLRKEIAWLRRRPKARTSKPRFRIEQAEALQADAADDPAARPLQLGTGRTRLGTQVYELTDVTVVRGERTVLDGVDLGIGPGERVGIVGPNGAGKTTLLHVLAGSLPVDAGEVQVGRTVHAGIYEQQAGAGMDADQTVLDSVLEIAPHVPLATGERLPAHRLAERFGFDSATQRTPIGRLSGGERRRVALLHLLVDAPNVLLLDEPTNDLDLDTLAVLEDHLDGFEGTLVVASHDRFVLDRLTDRTIAVEHGQLTEYLDLDHYRASRAASPATAPDRHRAGPAGPARNGGAADPSRARAQDNQARQAARKQARSLERRMHQLEERRDALHRDMTAAAQDPDRLLGLQRELAEVEEELIRTEDTWLELTVDLDA